MMGMRLAEGLDAARFEARTGTRLEDAFSTAARERLIAAGYLKSDTKGMRVTAEGRQRLNAVIAALLNA